MPEGLGLGTRRFGDMLPALLDVVQLARGVLDVLRLRALGIVDAELRPHGLRSGDQFFLDGGVGETLPLVHLPQLVQARRDHGQGRLHLFDERMQLARVHARGRFDGGAQVAHRTIRFAQREVLGRRALHHALDELFDPEDLLLLRTLGGGAPFFRALTQAPLRLGKPRGDRRVRTVGLRHERLPLIVERPPRFEVLERVLRCRDALGFLGQRVHPRVNPIELLPPLMTLHRATARVVEARPQLGVRALLLGGAREPFPFRPRAIDVRDSIVTAERFDAFAERFEGAPALRHTLGFGSPLGLRAFVLLDRVPRVRQRRSEAGHGVFVGFETGTADELAPLGVGIPKLDDGVGRLRRSPKRLHVCDHGGHALLPLLARRPTGGLRIDEFLEHRPAALRNRLALGAHRDLVEQLPPRRIRGGCRDRTLEGGDAGVLVVRFKRHRGQFGRVGHARERVEGGLRIAGVASDARQQLRVVDARDRGGPDRVVRRRFRNRRKVLLIAQPVEGERRVAVGLGRCGGDAHETVGQLAPKRVVFLGPCQPRQVADDANPCDGGAPDADVLVRGRQLSDDGPMLGIVRHFRQASQPDSRIRVAPLGLGLETIEERHWGALQLQMLTSRYPRCLIPFSSPRAIRLAVRFLCEPLSDLLAGHPVIVVEVDDHRCQRQPLLAALGAPFSHLVEAAEQPLQVIGYELSVLARQVIHTLVHRTERARTALLVEIAAEALRSAPRSRADELRQLFLFVLEFCRHRESPRVRQEPRVRKPC